MISFRMSEDDYLLLKNGYESHGTRSVSALARDALHSVIHCPRTGPWDLTNEVLLLHNKIDALQNELAHLSRMLGKTLSNKTAD
jgi:hypothetical protein